MLGNYQKICAYVFSGSLLYDYETVVKWKEIKNLMYFLAVFLIDNCACLISCFYVFLHYIFLHCTVLWCRKGPSNKSRRDISINPSKIPFHVILLCNFNKNNKIFNDRWWNWNKLVQKKKSMVIRCQLSISCN